MQTLDIFEKFKEFLVKGKVVEDVFPEILEKHEATDITSGLAEKLDGISDPFERLVVGVHVVDQLDLEDSNEMRH